MSADLLIVQDVICSFGNFRVLDSVSLQVAEQEFHGLIGPNGAGKSTFFNAVTGMVRIQKGSIRLSEEPISGFSSHRIAKLGIARTFQTARVFAGRTLIDHVRLASEVSPRSRPEDALLALQVVGLDGWAGVPVERLSYSAKKKLSLAICLAGRPRLLLLDEPAAGLEETETNDFADMLREVRERYSLTIVLVEHKLSFLMSLSNTITVLDHGRVIASGPPTEVAENPAVIEAYLGSDGDA